MIRRSLLILVLISIYYAHSGRVGAGECLSAHDKEAVLSTVASFLEALQTGDSGTIKYAYEGSLAHRLRESLANDAKYQQIIKERYKSARMNTKEAKDISENQWMVEVLIEYNNGEREDIFFIVKRKCYGHWIVDSQIQRP